MTVTVVDVPVFGDVQARGFKHAVLHGPGWVALHPRVGPDGEIDPSFSSGRIEWSTSDPNPIVEGLFVAPRFRRKGLATVLWNTARTLEPRLRHSSEQTADGAAWAATVPQ